MSLPSTIRKSVLALVVNVAWAPSIVVAAPYGEPFRVHEFGVGDQAPYHVAAGANGDVAILWSDGAAHFISRYDAAGRPLQSRPLAIASDAYDVVMSGTGSFAVLSQPTNGPGRDLFVGLYDRAGNPLIEPFMVNAPTADQRVHFGGSIAMNARGQFAIVWQRWAASGSGSLATEVFARRYEANGAPTAPAALVRSAPARVLGDDVDIDGRGNFTVIWNEVVGSGMSADLYGRRYSASGSPIAPGFLINGGETQPAGIAMNNAGMFVVATSSRVSSLKWALNARRFSASGAQLGIVSLSPQQSDAPRCMALDIASDGAFVATWSETIASGVNSIMTRSFDANGAAVDSPTTVSAAGADISAFACPGVAIDPAGNSTVVWQQRESASSPDGWDAFARRYLPASASVTPLASGETATGLAGSAGSWRYFKTRVEPGQTTLDVTMSGISGDADLYLGLGVLPTLTLWDGRPYLNGSNEAVRMQNFPPGDWYIGVHGFTTYSSVSLTARSY